MAFTTPWKTMTQEELDYQYSPSKWSIRMGPDQVLQAHIKVAAEESEAAIKDLSGDCELDVICGPGPEQKINIFGNKSLPADAPFYVFIHGGYWQEMSLALSSYHARTLVKAGAVVVTVGYDLCPKVTMGELISQVETAVCKILKLAKERGSRGVYLCGHSAGGHLAAMMLAKDWSRDHRVDGSLIKGALLVAGCFDLRPLAKSYVNEPIGLTAETAWQYSPFNHIQDIIKFSQQRKIRVMVGDYESSEFKRVSREMANALKEGGVDAAVNIIPEVDHFNVIEDFMYPTFQGTKILFEMMGIRGS